MTEDNNENKSSLSGQAMKQAAKKAMNKAGSKVGTKVAGKVAGSIMALLAPFLPIIIPFVILGLGCFFLFSFLSWLNPFSVTNTVAGDNEEAMVKDMGDDDEFKEQAGIDGQIDDEAMGLYSVDDVYYDTTTGLEVDKKDVVFDSAGNPTGNVKKIDGQYTKMARILQDNVEAGYNKTLDLYHKEKEEAKNSVEITHNNANKMYSYNGKYYTSAVADGTRVVVTDNPVSGEINPYGDDWNDAEYLEDKADEGKLSRGVAYIMAAYSVSRGDTAPPAGADSFSYYTALQDLLSQDDVQLGFFPYQGIKKCNEITMKSTVINIEKETRYEAKTEDTSDGFDWYCYPCTIAIDYSVEGASNDSCMIQNLQLDGDTGNWTHDPCPVCGSTTSDYTAGRVVATPYEVWVQKEMEEEQDFTYNLYSFEGYIGEFDNTDILERLFLDDNEFYKDAQYSNTNGNAGGGAATIGSGTEITLPAGLGSAYTYMGWQCITNRNSQQYKLMEATGTPFDSEGFGKINGRYVIACTTTYGNVGDYIDFYLENGFVIQAIIGDIKNTNDAGCNNWGHQNGQNVIEFVVDKSTWYSGGKGSHENPGTSTCHPEWGNTTVVKAVKGGNYFDDPNFVKSLAGDEPGTVVNNKSSDAQLSVVGIAISQLGVTGRWKAGYCADFTNSIYEMAGLSRPPCNAIDYWTKWGSTGGTDPTKIPLGACVVASGSDNPNGGRIYGHVGIYVGDLDGDGEGEVIDNCTGKIDKHSLSQWLSWQTTPVYAYDGSGTYGPGFIGWVWPNGEKLGDGVDYTGVSPDLVKALGKITSFTDTREQKLYNVLQSPYYQWVVYYYYDCEHDPGIWDTCEECGAGYKLRVDPEASWWQRVLSLFTKKYDKPVFDYVRSDEPDDSTLTVMRDDGTFVTEQHVYTVSEKIDWFVENMVDTIDTAVKYEQGVSLTSTGSGQKLVNFALERLGNDGTESWEYAGFRSDWCAMFVSMCAYKCGYIGNGAVCYARDGSAFGEGGIIPRYNVVSDGAYAFQSIGRYQRQDSGYVPQPGDIAFISWGNGKEIVDTQHTEIVIGVDETNHDYVYTVGGNTGSGGRGFMYSHVNKQHLYAPTEIAGYGVPDYPATAGAITDGDSTAIKDYLLSCGLTNAGAAGLMGNLEAESGLRGNRLQGDFSDGYEVSIAYTQKVDSGEISKYDFAHNGPNGGGYGVCQFTYYSLKEQLYDFVKSKGASIGDLQTQLEFLVNYLKTNYSRIWAVLTTSNNVEETTRIVLYDFERPARPNLSQRKALADKYL